VPRANVQTTLAVLMVGRSAIEAVLFAALLAVAQVMLAGDRPVPIIAVALALTGGGIVLASILRDARADRQNVAIALGAMAAAAAFGVSYAAPHPEGVMVLTRVVLFGIIGEAFVWRNLSLARSLLRWSDARNAGFTAIGAVAVVALLPGAIDRSGLVIAGLLAIAATGIALSVARSAEELSLAGREARGSTDRSTASGTVIILAILSVLGAIIAPSTGELLRGLGEGIAPIVGSLLYGVLLAFGYVAELFVNAIRALATGFVLPLPRAPLIPPLSPEQEAEQLRQFEASRPYLLGAAEVAIAVVALLLSLIHI